MFEVDPERSWVDPGLGPITSLIQSLNTPLVAAGTHPAENVQSWIVTRGSSAGSAEVFVFFHLTESNQAVLYRWDGGPVPGDQQEQVVEEAMGFCESMGFMMDNLNFGQLPPDKRGELLQTLPPFVQDLANLQPRDVEEIPLSMSKKVVDPVEEFARARAAMAESGQATASDFVDPNDAGIEFDPSQLMGDVGVAPAASADGDMQIEITEIEGLDLQPAEPVASGPASGRVESSVRELDLDDEPPLVVGAAVTPAPVPASAPPVVRGRERTPAGEVTVFDDAATAVGMMPPPAAGSTAAAAAAPAAAAPPTAAEFDVDDLLADVEISQPSGNGAAAAGTASASAAADFDVSSALDDILDGVESSKPATPPPAASAAAPADDISLDIDLDSSLEASISSPDEALVALEALGVPDEAGTGAPSPPPASPNPIPARPAVEAAWATEAGQSRANGNGAAHNGAAVRLDISTDELARLLSML